MAKACIQGRLLEKDDPIYEVELDAFLKIEGYEEWEIYMQGREPYEKYRELLIPGQDLRLEGDLFLLKESLCVVRFTAGVEVGTAKLEPGQTAMAGTIGQIDVLTTRRKGRKMALTTLAGIDCMEFVFFPDVYEGNEAGLTRGAAICVVFEDKRKGSLAERTQLFVKEVQRPR